MEPKRNLLSTSLGLLLTSAALAQAPCGLEWLPGASTFGPGGSVRAVVELPNGDLVVGGSFDVADQELCRNVARFDGTTWRALGDGLNSFVSSLVVMPNGDLIAGGGFSSTGNTYIGRVARWDGTAWTSIGADVPGTVVELAVAPNGDLIVAGSFPSIGNVPVDNVARWDGTTFSAIGDPGLFMAWAIDFLPNGDLLLGGDAAVGVPDVVRWNGAAWSALAGVPTNQLAGVRDLAALPNGDVALIATNFQNPSDVRVWNGAGLATFTSPLTAVRSLRALPNGDLLLGGVPGASGDDVVRLSGGAFVPEGDTTADAVQVVAVASNGDLVAGGGAPVTTTPTAAAVSRRSGGAWTGLGTTGPLPTVVHAVERLANGDVVVGGTFTEFFGVQANNIARFDGTSWQPLGLGADGPVYTLELAPDGSLLVGGGFQNAGGAPAMHVARWQAGAWSTLGAGLPTSPAALAMDDNGRVAALLSAPYTNVVRVFDGQGWSPVNGLVVGTVRDLAAIPGGDFVMLGSFLVGQPLPVGALTFDAALLAVVPGSEDRSVVAADRDLDGGLVLVLAGFNQTVVARLDGGVVTPVITGPPLGDLRAVTVLPDGDVVVAGGPTGGAGLLRHDGAAWQTIDGGLSFGDVRDLAVDGRGDLYACGEFLAAGGHTSIAFARAASTCRATVATFGAGCVGSNGAVTLQTGDRPWIGGTLRQTATGMAQPSLAVHAVGFGTTVQPLPLGRPGCALFVQPALAELLVPSAGAVDATLAIPTDPALAGQVLVTQVVGVELDASLSITGTTGSNALELVLGAL